MEREGQRSHPAPHNISFYDRVRLHDRSEYDISLSRFLIFCVITQCTSIAINTHEGISPELKAPVTSSGLLMTQREFMLNTALIISPAFVHHYCQHMLRILFCQSPEEILSDSVSIKRFEAFCMFFPAD